MASEKAVDAPKRDLGGDTRATGSHDSLTHVGSVRSDNEKANKVNDKEASAMLENPLANKSAEELQRDVDEFVERTGLHEHRDLLFKGALLAQDRDNFERLDMLSTEERESLRREKTHKWHQTPTLYWTIFLCSMAAVVQGMDETVINGAQLFYPEQFGIGGDSRRDTSLVGLVNGAPYLCSAVFSCWLTYPLNRYLGRRGAIFASTFFAGATCIWSAVTNTWWHLFIARFFLGIGIDNAEIAPPLIRGALVMQWQVWTAFGIMLGTVSSLIFQKVEVAGITGLNWRLMLGSACLPAIIVCAQVYFVPESPRWLISRNRHAEAFASYRKFCTSDVIAARELYYASTLIEVEQKVARAASKSRIAEFFTLPRNRRAILASTIVMFGQQFCGVNAIAYYSSNIFKNAGYDNTRALLGSFGFGLLNWVFALPAFFTIDTFGRRSLLLFTFPFLSLSMLIAGMGFLIKNTQGSLAMVTTGIYLFTCFYSPGMGPVPFSYSAEVYPITVREIGMALATATTWLFNFVIAFTLPLLLVAFTSTGTFCWFAGWNALLFFLTLLFLPETKQRTLEELDEVFSMKTSRLAAYGLATPWFQFQRVILRRDVHRTPLYEFNPSEEKDKPQVEHREKV